MMLESWYEAVAGRTVIAIKQADSAIAMGKRVNFSYAITFSVFGRAWAHYKRGEYGSSREDLDSLLAPMRAAAETTTTASDPSYLSYLNVSFMLNDLKENKIGSVKQRLKETRILLKKPSDVDSFKWRIWVENACDLIEAEVLLAEGSPDAAIRTAEAATPPELTDITWEPTTFYHNAPIERDVLARAYLAKGAVNKAISEYERLVTFDPKGDYRLLSLPIYHYRLAKLYERKGRAPEATREYERFLSVTREADIYLAEIKDATKRVAALRAGAG